MNIFPALCTNNIQINNVDGQWNGLIDSTHHSAFAALSVNIVNRLLMTRKVY